MACGWWCEMHHHTYDEASLEGDLRSLDFLAEVGITWLSDNHPWAGETECSSPPETPIGLKASIGQATKLIMSC
ncbi:MAG: hypothetical protein ACR2H1_11800 [Limisphaerales bacterium]